jgi:hypothetical protein
MKELKEKGRWVDPCSLGLCNIFLNFGLMERRVACRFLSPCEGQKEGRLCFFFKYISKISDATSGSLLFLLTLDLSRNFRSFSNSSISDSGILKWKLSK